MHKFHLIFLPHHFSKKKNMVSGSWLVAFLFYTALLCDGGVIMVTNTVTLKNVMLPDTRLGVHCKSKRDDFGAHTILKGETYSFKFTANLFHETVLYVCHFQWMSNGTVVNKWFNIIDNRQRSTGLCSSFHWTVYSNVICCLLDTGIEDACYGWKP